MEVTVKVPLGSGRVAVVGSSERNLKLLREALSVGVHAREGRVVISGGTHAVTAARRVLEALVDAAERDEPLNRQQVLDMIAEETAQAQRARRGWRSEGRGGGRADDADAPFAVDGASDLGEDPDDHWEDRLNVYVGGKAVRPRTPNQEAYLRAIREHDLVFGLGPAGTGKTYLAVAAAVHLLRAGRVKRVVLTRPAVEAGEKLGYLPGDLREKVHPYLRPLFDALNDMMDFSTARRFMDNDVVEVVPLAFMRGRTLNHSVIILDEAQNCTKSQMMMFLTRMGQGSKMIVTGDPTQTDLPDDAPSGLLDAAGRLARTKGVAFVGFQQQDVVRHDLVRRIIDAYGDDRAEGAPWGERRGGKRGDVSRGPRISTPSSSEPRGDRSRVGESEPGGIGSMNDGGGDEGGGDEGPR